MEAVKISHLFCYLFCLWGSSHSALPSCSAICSAHLIFYCCLLLNEMFILNVWLQRFVKFSRICDFRAGGATDRPTASNAILNCTRIDSGHNISCRRSNQIVFKSHLKCPDSVPSTRLGAVILNSQSTQVAQSKVTTKKLKINKWNPILKPVKMQFLNMICLKPSGCQNCYLNNTFTVPNSINYFIILSLKIFKSARIYHS